MSNIIPSQKPRNCFHQRQSHIPSVRVVLGDIVAMARFEEILDSVCLALTSASPAEIQALLEGLVKEQIISEAFSNSLSLHRLTKGLTAEPVHAEGARQAAADLINQPRPTNQLHRNQGQLSQICRDCGTNMSNQRGQSVSTMEEYNNMSYTPIIDSSLWMDKLNHGLLSTQKYYHGLTLDNNMTEMLRDTKLMQKPVNDYERMNQGNSEEEKEWLEQVGEVARRIAVPLWQHWGRGQRMLLPLIPSTANGCAQSQKVTTGNGAQCPVLNLEQETELAITCRMLDLYADNFNHTEAAITDPGFTLDPGGATGRQKGLHFSPYGSVAATELDANHFSIPGVGRCTSQVKACAADTDTLTAAHTLSTNLDGCWVADSSRDTAEDLLHMMLSVPDCEANVGSWQGDGLPGEERGDSQWGKFVLYYL